MTMPSECPNGRAAHPRRSPGKTRSAPPGPGIVQVRLIAHGQTGLGASGPNSERSWATGDAACKTSAVARRSSSRWAQGCLPGRAGGKRAPAAASRSRAVARINAEPARCLYGFSHRYSAAVWKSGSCAGGPRVVEFLSAGWVVAASSSSKVTTGFSSIGNPLVGRVEAPSFMPLRWFW